MIIWQAVLGAWCLVLVGLGFEEDEVQKESETVQQLTLNIGSIEDEIKTKLHEDILFLLFVQKEVYNKSKANYHGRR